MKLLVILFLFLISLLLFFLQRQLYITQKTAPQSHNFATSIVSITPIFQNKLPSIDQIFARDHAWTATLSAERKRVLIATGDVIPARSVNYKTVTLNNFNWPFENTVDVLKTADVTFVNLETPLLRTCPLTQEGMIFCGDSRNAEGLFFAGVDVVSLANNHAGNYGLEGVEETRDLLSRKGILTTGINGQVIKDIRGKKFAFLGYNDITSPQPGISNVDEEKMRQEIAQARKQADIIIVTLHFGVEYRSKSDERQVYLAHLAIDSGADLVIGNHPHWIQPVEIYKEKLITYAHGNFVFDQEWSLKTKQGVIGKYTFFDNSLIDVEFFPVQIDNYGQPYFLANDEKSAILGEMKKDSRAISW